MRRIGVTLTLQSMLSRSSQIGNPIEVNGQTDLLDPAASEYSCFIPPRQLSRTIGHSNTDRQDMNNLDIVSFH
jgi:hypothetical protein